MIDRNFDQASALISRLMEGVGGSSDAYSEPLSTPGPINEAPEPREGEEETTFSNEEICSGGEAVFDPEDRSWWTNPPPITDDYEPHGVVEEAGELEAIYNAICDSLDKGATQPVQLETGTYHTEPQHGGTWVLKDTVKDRLYCQERTACSFDVVDEQDVFIWVMSLSNRDVDLGYIHEGYVFLHK